MFRHRSKMENLSADEKRHFRVKKWTKNINIFEKDFVFIPINDSSHWYLIVICFPNLDGCRTMDKDEPYDTSKGLLSNYNVTRSVLWRFISF